jgi:hypothetical protein
MKFTKTCRRLYCRSSALAIVALLFAGRVRAAELITNGSFELPHADSGWITEPFGRFILAAPTGWNVTSVEIGPFEPSSLAFPSGIPDGTQVAAVGNELSTGGLFQDVTENLSFGMQYSLTAWVGSRADAPGSGIVSLETVAGDVLATSGIVTPADGTWQQIALTYSPPSGSPFLGDGLRVLLSRAGGIQSDFDSISLTAAAVPEPATIVLGLCGGAALLGWRLRSRRVGQASA